MKLAAVLLSLGLASFAQSNSVTINTKDIIEKIKIGSINVQEQSFYTASKLSFSIKPRKGIAVAHISMKRESSGDFVTGANSASVRMRGNNSATIPLKLTYDSNSNRFHYNQDTREVIYTSEAGEQVVCAKNKKFFIFGPYVKVKKNCFAAYENETKQYEKHTQQSNPNWKSRKIQRKNSKLWRENTTRTYYLYVLKTNK